MFPLIKIEKYIFDWSCYDDDLVKTYNDLVKSVCSTKQKLYKDFSTILLLKTKETKMLI